MLNLCTLGGSQRPFVLVCGMLYMPPIVHIIHISPPRMMCAVRHTKSAGSLLSFQSWNVHDSVQELDMCALHKLLHVHMRRALGLRRGVVADDVVLLVGVGLDSSIIDNVIGVLSFFLFPLVDVFGNTKQCIIVFRSLL